MRIVCLAWGSLVWKPGVLPVEASGWQRGGPALPIEFARVGDHGELATALCPGAPVARVRWARLATTDLAAAGRLLAEREEVEPGRRDGVGSVVVGQAPGGSLGAEAILRWAAARGDVDAVVWTALPPRLDGAEGRAPGPAEAAAYLRSLTGAVRRHAEDYVRRVPEEIATPNRAALEQVIAGSIVP